MISNPNSTSISDETMRYVVPPLLAVPGLQLLSKHTAYAGHATDMCRGLSRADYDVVIAMGGDGTVNEVVSGLLGSGPTSERPDCEDLPAVAVIPSGSANVLAGALGIPRDSGAAARLVAHLLAEEATRTISAGRADSTWFIVNAGLGMDAEVIHNMDTLREKGVTANPAHYGVTVLQTWRQLRGNPPQLSCRADGEVIGEGLAMAVVSNSNPWTFVDALPVVTNPHTTLDGGLGVWGLTTIGSVRGIAALVRLAGGPRSWDPLNSKKCSVATDNASSVVLESERELHFQVDGEAIGKRRRIEVEAVPRCIRMVAPPAQRDFAATEAKNPWWVPVTRRLRSVVGLDSSC
nr:diacylglycerol kinase family protein [Corynebacterium sp. TAE3-ERU12]